jgi:hypothetical protein
VDLVQLLRAAGSPHAVVDDRVDPAPGLFDPVGVMVHHTAGASLDVRGLQSGYGFPGPLCNVAIDRDGTRHVVTDGRANDSGMGSAVVLDDVRADRPVTADARDRGLADDVSGNPWFYDVEVVNDGRGQPYPPVQLDALAATCAALCAAHGWPAGRCIHHRQWTRRKPDMSWRGDLVGLVARHLDRLAQEDDMAQLSTEDLDRIAGAVWDRKLLGGSTAGRRLAKIDDRTAKLLSREAAERTASELGVTADEVLDALHRRLAE